MGWCGHSLPGGHWYILEQEGEQRMIGKELSPRAVSAAPGVLSDSRDSLFFQACSRRRTLMQNLRTSLSGSVTPGEWHPPCGPTSLWVTFQETPMVQRAAMSPAQ